MLGNAMETGNCHASLTMSKYKVWK